LQALLQHVDWTVVKAVVVASPGFVKDQFMEYLTNQIQKQDLEVLRDKKDRFIKARCSSGHRHSLKEVLSDPSIMEQLKDVKAASEVAVLSKFFDTFNIEPDRAVYGLPHVTAADESAAIDTLLLTDELFRVEDIKLRRTYVALTESVKEKNGSVYIFSTLHPSGEQLRGLTGVAAILRFPLNLDHIDNELDSSTSEDDSSSAESQSDEEFETFNLIKGTRSTTNNNNNN
jgi:protein pelota